MNSWNALTHPAAPGFDAAQYTYALLIAGAQDQVAETNRQLTQIFVATVQQEAA